MMKMKTITGIILAAAAALSVCASAYADAGEAPAIDILPIGCMQDFEGIELTEEEAALADAQIEELYKDLDYSVDQFSDSEYFSSKYNSGYFSFDYTDDYFYVQLNSEEKQFYDGMYDACAKFMDLDTDLSDSNKKIGSASYKGLSYDRAKNVYMAFRFSNPQFYFLSSGWSYTTTTWYLQCANTLYSGAARQTMINKIESKVSAWLPQINAGTDPLERIEHIYTILAANITYDFTDNDQTIAGAIGDGVCVCNGYTMAVNYLCHFAGIESIGVVSDGHAWNRVKLFGKWYELDVTWMDQEPYWGEPYLSMRWCLTSTKNFLANDSQGAHIVDLKYYVGFELPSCVNDEVIVPETQIMGDADCDGRITTDDAVIILQYAANYTVDIDLKAADVTGDGNVTSDDAVEILRKLANYDVDF